MKIKTIFCAAMLSGSITYSIQANSVDLVFDAAVEVQTAISAVQETLQTAKQIEEYATQVLQYKNQLVNTVSQPVWYWDQVMGTFNQIMGLVNIVDGFKTRYGSLDYWLNHYKDLSTYRMSPCYGPNGCSESEYNELHQSLYSKSEDVKDSTDAFFRGINEEQSIIEEDVRNLQRLQSQAESSDGQKKALDSANQLLSALNNQVIQYRQMFMASQQAILARQQAIQDLEAMQQASEDHFRSDVDRIKPDEGLNNTLTIGNGLQVH